jgi:DNA (cytosine-5)-methyltransferase 1
MTTRPSPTITGGGTEAGGAEPIAKYHERYTSAPGWVGATDRLTTNEAAALQSYPVGLRPEVAAWKWVDAPATTIAGDPRITAREHHFHGEQSKTSLRLTKDEAVVLQSYERPFIWCGTKTKQFLQIGNAVPPLLAEHILAALVGIPTVEVAA